MNSKIYSKLDKTVITIVPLSHASNDKEYWLSKFPAERLQAVEELRRLNYGDDKCSARLQKVLEITQRTPR